MDKSTAELMQPVKRHMESYLNEWIGEYNTDVARRLKNISSAMFRMEEELQRCNENELAGLVHSGADSMERISEQVRDGEAQDLMEILEQQGREHPAGALLASMTAGFLSTRAVRHKAAGDGAGQERPQSGQSRPAAGEPSGGRTAQAQYNPKPAPSPGQQARASTSQQSTSRHEGGGDGTSKSQL